MRRVIFGAESSYPAAVRDHPERLSFDESLDSAASGGRATTLTHLLGRQLFSFLKDSPRNAATDTLRGSIKTPKRTVAQKPMPVLVGGGQMTDAGDALPPPEQRVSTVCRNILEHAGAEHIGKGPVAVECD